MPLKKGAPKRVKGHYMTKYELFQNKIKKQMMQTKK